MYVTCTPSEVIKTISTGAPAGKVTPLGGLQVKATLAGALGGRAVVVVVPVVGAPLEVVVVVIVAVVRGVEHIRVPFVNSSSAVAMETVGLPGGL